MKRMKQHFIISNICVIISTCSLLSIMFLQWFQNQGIYQFVSIIIALLFWSGLLAELMLISITSFDRKRLKLYQNQKKMKIGLISFIKTPVGKIADVLLLISAMILMIQFCLNIGDIKSVIPVLSLLYLSFHMHCLYNGRNYQLLRVNLKRNKERKYNE